MSPRDSRDGRNERIQRPPFTRRELLQSTGGLLVTGAIAGCLGGDSSNGGSSGVIRDLTSEGELLTVTLAESSEVTKVNFIGPDGGKLQSKSVSAGQTTVELPLLERDGYKRKPLKGGTYEIVAAKDSTEISRKSIDIRLKYKISSVKIVPDSSSDPTRLQFTIKNTGDAPLKPKWFAVPNGVPDPVKKEGVRRNHINIGEKRTYDTSAVLTFFDKSNAKCQGEAETVTIETKMFHNKKQEHQVKIIYGGGARRESRHWYCENPSATIVDGNE